MANGKYQGFKVLLKLTLGMEKMEVILNRLRFQNKSRRLTKFEIMLFSHPRSKRSFQIIHKTSDLMPYGWHICNNQHELPI